jgi:hypothetical protein
MNFFKSLKKIVRMVTRVVQRIVNAVAPDSAVAQSVNEVAESVEEWVEDSGDGNQGSSSQSGGGSAAPVVPILTPVQRRLLELDAMADKTTAKPQYGPQLMTGTDRVIDRFAGMNRILFSGDSPLAYRVQQLDPASRWMFRSAVILNKGDVAKTGEQCFGNIYADELSEKDVKTTKQMFNVLSGNKTGRRDTTTLDRAVAISRSQNTQREEREEQRRLRAPYQRYIREYENLPGVSRVASAINVDPLFVQRLVKAYSEEGQAGVQRVLQDGSAYSRLSINEIRRAQAFDLFISSPGTGDSLFQQVVAVAQGEGDTQLSSQLDQIKNGYDAAYIALSPSDESAPESTFPALVNMVSGWAQLTLDTMPEYYRSLDDLSSRPDLIYDKVLKGEIYPLDGINIAIIGSLGLYRWTGGAFAVGDGTVDFLRTGDHGSIGRITGGYFDMLRAYSMNKIGDAIMKPLAGEAGVANNIFNYSGKLYDASNPATWFRPFAGLGPSYSVSWATENFYSTFAQVDISFTNPNATGPEWVVLDGRAVDTITDKIISDYDASRMEPYLNQALQGQLEEKRAILGMVSIGAEKFEASPLLYGMKMKGIRQLEDEVRALESQLDLPLTPYQYPNWTPPS